MKYVSVVSLTIVILFLKDNHNNLILAIYVTVVFQSAALGVSRSKISANLENILIEQFLNHSAHHTEDMYLAATR